jgi:kynurenine formamidase
MAPDLPTYDELPRAPRGGGSAWGLFGEANDLGLLNLQDAAGVVAAARLIKTGKVFALDAPLDAFTPPLVPGRGPIRRTNSHPAGSNFFDDVVDNFYPQCASQWDGLGHVGYSPDEYYNGATAQQIDSGQRLGIDGWARKGIVGRAVVLDLQRSRAEAGRPYEPGESEAFSVEDLEAARELARVSIGPGDVLLLHTGYAAWYAELDTAAKRAVPANLTSPGIDHTEDMARYLWDAHVAGVACDAFAVEVYPRDTRPESQPFGFLHQILLGQFGMALGELWWLRQLAEDCAADGVYEAFLSSAPLHLPGGIGSPANAIAIK